MAIHDISLAISPTLPVWPGDPAIALTQPAHMDRGDVYTLTRIDISVHTGTHLDAPAHFIPGGSGVETLDLDVLIGPALVVDARDTDQLTAAVLQRLPIPPGTRRVLFHTRNSDRWARGETAFAEDYVAVTTDAAQWLVDRDIRLVGVDYLSVSPYDDPIPTHRILLGAGVIPVEGLNLHDIAPGAYQLVCLPLKIQGSDGAPARAVLIDIT